MNRPRQKLDIHSAKKITRVKSIPHRPPEIVAEIDGMEIRLELDLGGLEPQHRTALSRDSSALGHVIVAVLAQAVGLKFDEIKDGPTTHWLRKI